MAVIWTEHGGMTVRDTPSVFAGGGSSTRGTPALTPPPPQVQIKGGEVFIGGQGFSVRPEDQAAFIQQQTGGKGASAQVAMQRAREIAQQQVERARQQQVEIQRQQAEAQRQQTQQRTIQASAVSTGQPTPSGVTSISDPLSYYRTKEFGTQYSDYQRRLQEEARRKGRSLYASEREKIAGEFVKEEKVDIKTKYYPGVSLEPRPLYFSKTGEGAATFIVGFTPDISKVDTRTYGTTYVPPTFKIDDLELLKQTEKQIYSIPKLDDVTKAPRKETISGIQEYPEETPSFISRPPTRTKLLREKHFYETAVDKPTVLGFAGGLTAGALLSVVGSYKGVKGLVTQPVETIGRTAQAIVELPKNWGAIATIARTEPAFALGFVSAEIGQVYLFSKGYRYAIQRQTIITPTRKIIEPKFVEQQVYGISKGRQYKFSVYDITGEYKPPRIKIVTTKLRQKLGIKPISTKYIPPQKFLVKTTYPAIDSFPFQVVEARTGSHILRYKTISGESTLINPRVARLSNIDEFLLKRYVQSKTGTQFLGRVEQIKLPRLSPEKYAKLSPDIDFSGKLTKKQLGEYIGGHHIDISGKRYIGVRGYLKGELRQQVIAHELIHAKTPKSIIKLSRKLPYEYRPSEIIAYRLEKSVARKGFKDIFSPKRIDLVKYKGKEIPISSKTARTFTKKGTEFELSDISTIKTYKYNIKTGKTTYIDDSILKTTDIKDFRIRFGTDKTYAEVGFGKVRFEAGRGRVTETSRALTRTKEFIDLPDYELLTSETYFKDVTKPFARARGKTPRLTGEIYIKKEPIFIDKFTDVKFVQTADIVKTPLSRTFQVTEQAEQLAKIVPKISPAKTITTIAPTTMTSRIIPVTPRLAQIFTAQTTTPIVSTTQPTIVFEGRIPSDTLRGLSFEKTMEGQISIPKTQAKELTKTLNKTLTKTRPKLITKGLLKTLTKTLLKQQPKLAQKLQLKQIQKYKLTPKQKIITPTFPKVPGKPTTWIPPLLKGRGMPKQPSGRFPVYGRRFGKYRVVGVGRTEKEAFSLGKKFARGTLGVTFKIPKAKRLKVPGFRTKREKGGIVFIEPRGKRLKKGTREIPEILYYKKLKGGRKKKKK